MTAEPTRRVRLLPDSLINKIAAGEVVERPASVIKELLENAADAEAARLVVSVTDGGRGMIRVRDDGVGMGRDDALAALQRHATSKLRDDADLFNIATFGFRGEALPSIAEVSRFELITGEPGAQVGTRVVVDGGVIETIEDAANPGGTEITVRRLFANTPARLKFLKSDKTENRHITEWVTRVALAHPEIAVRLEVDGRTAFDLPAETELRPRVRALLGKAVASELHPFSASQPGLTVEGLISAPTLTRSNAAGLYLFVNGRFVKDRAMTGAVLQAWRELLPRGRYPVAVLFLDLPPDRVDVNVHPQKLEVRFRDGQAVWRFLSGALARTLRERGGVLPTPSVQTSFLPPAARGGLRPTMPAVGNRPVRPWSPEQAAAVLDRARLPGSGPSIPTPPPSPPIVLPEDEAPVGPRLVGRLDAARLVLSDDGALIVLDVGAARRLVLFHRLLRAPDEPLATRRLLVPSLLDLDPPQARALDRNADAVAPFGMEVGAFGPDTVALHGLAPELDSRRGEELLRAVRDALRDGPPKGAARTRELARVISAFAHPGTDRPAAADVVRLLDALGPHLPDRPADLPRPLVRLTTEEVDRWFARGRP